MVPEGSLVLRNDDVAWGPYDGSRLSHPWDYAHVGLAELQAELTALLGDGCWEDDATIFRQMARAIGRHADRTFHLPVSRSVPRLTESWFCCAEPNDAQISVVAD